MWPSLSHLVWQQKMKTLLKSPGLSDWARNGHMIKAEPIRVLLPRCQEVFSLDGSCKHAWPLPSGEADKNGANTWQRLRWQSVQVLTRFLSSWAWGQLHPCPSLSHKPINSFFCSNSFQLAFCYSSLNQDFWLIHAAQNSNHWSSILKITSPVNTASLERTQWMHISPVRLGTLVEMILSDNSASIEWWQSPE